MAPRHDTTTHDPAVLAASLRELADELDRLHAGGMLEPFAGYSLEAEVYLHPGTATVSQYHRSADALGLRTREERAEDGALRWRDKTVAPGLTVTVFRPDGR